MTDICINQIEYSTRADGPLIHIFGRDKDGKAYRVDALEFKPYFYVPSDQINMVSPELKIDEGKFKSIHNEELIKIFVKNPFEMREAREKFPIHYESDILYTMRFLIDNKIKSGLSFEKNPCLYTDIKPIDANFPARFCIVDIECSDEVGFPDSSKDPIICITCYDSFDKKYTTFFTSRDVEKATEIIQDKMEKPTENGCFSSSHDIFICSNETEMLSKFANYIRENDPDILTGWNFTGFDAPYILGRMDILQVKRESIARLYGNSTRIEIRGRQLFDLLAGYKRMHLGEKESYRLDAIALAEVGRGKIRYAGKVSDLWKNDPANLVYYNFTDVELCVEIDKKDKTIEFHRHISHYVGCPLEKTTNSMPIVDAYVLRKAYGRLVLPSKIGYNDKGGASDGFEGATVFAPPKGVQENVVVLDLKSLYPMSMMTVNASPETKDPNGELHAPNGIRFKKEPDGLVREIQSEILKERDMTKAERNKHPFGSNEYKLLDMEQDVIKIIMNSYYGVSGNPLFRLYDRDVASATTSIGRTILEHNRKLVEEEGFRIVGGDTDSVFVKIPISMGRAGTMMIAKYLEKLLNDSYPEFAKTNLNADKQYFSVKFEKLYERFFSSGKKKRYAGLLVWKEGKDVRQVDITGFETERSDSPRVTREALKTLMGMILEGKSYDEIRTTIRGVIKKYRAGEYGVEEIGIPGGIGKAFDQYAVKDAQVRAAEYANQYFGTNFGKGSKPKRLYIKVTPSGYPKTDVIAFEFPDQVPENFVIDKDIMLEKTLESPIRRILESLGWSWEEFDPSVSTLSQWGF